MSEQRFKPCQIPLDQARPGDILVFDGQGWLYNALAWLIHKTVEKKWDGLQWHMAPVVGSNMIMNATWPRLELDKMSDAIKGRIVQAYRVFENPPEQEKLDAFVALYQGRWYDWLVYLLTALSILLRPTIDIPRIINRRYDCWETAFDFCDMMGLDISWDYSYPWLCDFLRYVGEL